MQTTYKLEQQRHHNYDLTTNQSMKSNMIQHGMPKFASHMSATSATPTRCGVCSDSCAPPCSRSHPPDDLRNKVVAKRRLSRATSSLRYLEANRLGGVWGMGGAPKDRTMMDHVYLWTGANWRVVFLMFCPLNQPVS